MKQEITIRDLEQLSPEATELLTEWQTEKGIAIERRVTMSTGDVITYIPYVMTIGEMIEFIDDFTNTSSWFDLINYGRLSGEYLCDALWALIRRLLETRADEQSIGVDKKPEPNPLYEAMNYEPDIFTS